MSAKSERSHHKSSAKDYLPLIILIVIAVIAAFAIDSRMSMMTWKTWMGTFMGLFFTMLAMFKFFDMKGFMHAFSMYDIPTHYFKPYAYIYPFIEFVLGLLYLAHVVMILANIVTIIVMAVSLVGVIQGLIKKKEAVCACMGPVLNVPLSTVSIVENVVMGLMALFMLF